MAIDRRMPHFRRMAARTLLRFAACVLMALPATGPASANICRSIEAELAAMSRPPSARERQAAAQAAYEAQRLRAHMHAIGCDRQPFLFLGPQPPAECRGYRAQLAQLQGQASLAPDEARRRHLAALFASNDCSSGGPRRSPPLTAGIFDDGVRRPGELSSIEIDPQREIEPSRPRLRAGKPVCVRTCDGYFFPLHLRGQGLADQGDAMCQSLCPGAETRIYFMQAGGIESAVSSEGEPYSELDNALRYRKSFDAACSCRRAEESRTLGPEVVNPDGAVAGGFDQLNGQIIIDVPLRGLTPSPDRRTDGALFTREPRPMPSPPPEIAIENLVTSDQGEMRTMRGPGGVTRSVRVIGLPPAAGPATAGAGAVPGRAPAP